MKKYFAALFVFLYCCGTAQAWTHGNSGGGGGGGGGATCSPPALSCIDVASGLVFWIPFDSSTTSGTTTNDLAASPANGTLTGAGTSIGAGQIGQAMVTAGSGSYTLVGAPTKLNFALGTGGTPFSLSAWINRSSDSADMIIVSKGYNGTSTQWFMKVNTGALTVICGGFVSGANHGVTSIGTNSANVWELWTCTFDGTSVYKIYKNGVLDNTATDATAIPTTVRLVEIGAVDVNGTPSQLFPGFIDDVRAYNRALAGSEITTIYTNGANGIPGGSLPSFAPGATGFLGTCSTTDASLATVPCPAGIAFRDFSSLTPGAVHPFVNSGAFSWNVNGITSFYPRPWTLVSGTYYAMGTGTATFTGTSSWMNIGLYTSSNPLVGWTVPSTAIITAVTNAWNNNYLLHPVFAPAGCSLGTYCVYLSAMNNAGADSIGVWSASSITGPYTAYGSNPIISAACTGGGVNVGGSMLPSVIQIGTTYYMYTANHDNTGTFLTYWTSPASDGLTWTCRGAMFRPVNSTDWDFASFFGIIDPHVWLNSHGFYEMFYTVEAGNQRIGYMISPNGTTWYKYTTAPIVTPSTFCNGLAFVGDAIINFEGGGTFQMIFDCSDGSAVSYVNSASMPDH